jgi:DNA polymerase V
VVVGAVAVNSFKHVDCPCRGFPDHHVAGNPASSLSPLKARLESHYNPHDTSYPSVCIPLPMPTADPVILTKAAHPLLPAIHEGIKYARAGIMVTDLRPTGNQKPLEIFENPHEERNIGPLLEAISRRYGRGSIGLGHGGIRGGPEWTMKRRMRSPRYTTHWDELPLVKAA